MGSALSIGLTLGGLSALGSFANSQSQAAQQRAQAAAYATQAEQTRNQARYQQEKGRIEAENIDRQKSQMRRDFEQLQGRNRSLLAAGNVDPTSGSAMDVQLGNIEMFANDIGENAYQKALKEWETREQVKQTQYQADIYDAQSSNLERTAGNIGQSLLTAGLSGASGFLSGYTMAGGAFGAGKGTLLKETNWDKVYNKGLEMRHPSGKWTFLRTN